MIQQQIDVAIKTKNEELLKTLLSNKENVLKAYPLSQLQINLIKNNLFNVFSWLINKEGKIVNSKNLIQAIMEVNTEKMNQFLDYIWLKEDFKKTLQDHKVFEHISASNISLLESDVNQLISIKLLKKLENDKQLLGQALSESIHSICRKSPNIPMTKRLLITNTTQEAKYLLKEIFKRWDDKISFKVLKEAILITLNLKNFELTDLLLNQRKDTLEFLEEEVYSVKKKTDNYLTHIWDEDHLSYFNNLGIDLTKKNLLLVLNSTTGKLDTKDFFHNYMLTQPIEKLKNLVSEMKSMYLYMPHYLKEKNIYASLLQKYELNYNLTNTLDEKSNTKKIKI